MSVIHIWENDKINNETFQLHDKEVIFRQNYVSALELSQFQRPILKIKATIHLLHTELNQAFESSREFRVSLRDVLLE